MKKYLITLLACLYFMAGNGQTTYYVSVVKGKVIKAGASVIKAGDKLTANDKVSFSSKADQLILLNPGSGRLVLSPQYNLPKTQVSLTGFIKDFLEMSAQQRRLSANSGKNGDSIKVKRLPSLKADSMRSMMNEQR